MADPEGQTSANEVNLVFKNPSRPLDDTFSMPCATSMTIGDLKTALQSEYPGKPASQAITLIYAGKVLKDDSVLLSSLLPSDSPTVAFHIVVKSNSSSSAAASVVNRSNINLGPHPSSSAVPTFTAQPGAPSIPVAAPRAAPASAVSNAEQAAAAPAPQQPTSTTTNATAPPPLFQQQQPQQHPTFSIAHPSPSYQEAYQAAYQAALQRIMNSYIDSNNANHHHHHQQPFVFNAMPQMPMMMMMPTHQQPPVMATPQARPTAPQPVPPGVEALLRHRRQVPRAEQILQYGRIVRQQGWPIPPELEQVLNQIDRQRAAVAAAANPAVANRRGRRFQIRIQINLRMLFQLAIMLAIVYQNSTPKRFVMLCTLGFLMWLSTMPRVRAFLIELAGLGNGGAPNNPRGRPRVQQQQPPVAAQNDGVQPPPIHQQQHGILHEIKAFIAGFITSLLPALENHNQQQEFEGVQQEAFRM